MIRISGIVSYMLEQAKPAAKFLGSVKEVQTFMASADVSIVGFFASENGALYEAFVDAAERTRGDFSVGYVLEGSVSEHFGANPPQVVLFYPEVPMGWVMSRENRQNTFADILVQLRAETQKIPEGKFDSIIFS